MSESKIKTTLAKMTEGYGYKYTELADINKALIDMGFTYYQYIDYDAAAESDYIYTVPVPIGEDGKLGAELKPRRGCKVTEATLSGKQNPAQEAGSSITYARRYSLLMAFGLATEDDDAASLNGATKKAAAKQTKVDFAAVRETIKNAVSREEVEKIYREVPAKLQQYFTDDCAKRVKQLEGDGGATETKTVRPWEKYAKPTTEASDDK